MKTLYMCNIWNVIFFTYILKRFLKNDNILSGVMIKITEINNGKRHQKKKNEKIPKNRIDFYLGNVSVAADTMVNILVDSQFGFD